MDVLSTHLIRRPILASLFVVLAILAIPSIAEAAKVKKIVKKKREVIIDQGKKDGIEKGSEVCIFDKNGDEIVCGKVDKVKNKTATIKIRSKKKLRLIKKGMEAELKAEDKSETNTEATASTNGGWRPDPRRNVKLMYVLTPVPPAQFKKISYRPPEQGAADGSQATLWDQTEDSGVSFLGFGAELDFLRIGTSMSLGFGVRYRAYRDFIADSDYDRTDGTVFARTDQKATSVGGYLNFFFLDIGDPFHIRMGAGLDMDKSTVSFRSDKLADDATVEAIPIGDANSSVTLLSLRVPIHLAFHISPVGLNFAIVPLVPLAEFGKTYQGLVGDENKSKVAGGDPDLDLQTALAHGKSSFGLELSWSLYLAF